MSRGGSRPGAGRKTNAQIAQVRKLMDDVVTDEKWKAIFNRMAEIAVGDDPRAAVQAANFLARYRWGVPAEQEPEEPEVVPIKYIEVNYADMDGEHDDADEDDTPDAETEDNDTAQEEPPAQPRPVRGPGRPAPVSFPSRSTPGNGKSGTVYRGPRRDPGR